MSEPDIDITPRELLQVLGLGAMLLFATLAFGAVHVWAWTILLISALLLTLTRLIPQVARGVRERARGPLLVAFGLVGILLLLQQVPLPHALAETLSPRAAWFHDHAVPHKPPADWLPLSMDRSGTLEASWKGLLYLLTFLLAAGVARRKGRVRPLLILLVLLGVFEACYGLWQLHRGESRIFAWANPLPPGRASGTYVNANHYAAFLGMSILVALGLIAQIPSGERPRSWRNYLIAVVTDKGFPLRLMLVGATLLMATAQAASLSRGGVLSTLFGVALLAFAVGRGRRNRGAGALVIVILVVLTLVLFRVDAVTSRFASLTGPGAGARVSFTLDTVRMAREFPLVGIGAGSFESVFARYQSVKTPGTRIAHAHSDVAQGLAELGAAGFVTLLLGLTLTWWWAWRSSRGRSRSRRTDVLTRIPLVALVPLAIHSFMDFNLRIPANALWAAALLGLAWGRSRRKSPTTTNLPERLAGPAGRVSSGLVLVVLALLAGGSAALHAWADWHAEPRIERSLWDPRPHPARIKSIEAALETWPWQPSRLSLLAKLRWELRTLPLAASSLAEAKKILGAGADSADVEQVRLAIVLAALKRPEGLKEAVTCLELLDQAARLRPADPYPMAVRRGILRGLGARKLPQLKERD